MVAAARQRFEELAQQPEGEIPLAETALVIAAERYPDLDVGRYLAALDDLATRVAPRLADLHTLAERADGLNRALFVDEGFSGNADDYYDPRNSFLNEVLDRRLGIPISLSVVWIEVARRAGLNAAGISFPGHFLTKLLGPTGDEVIVDPFHACRLDQAECEERLRDIAGSEAVFEPELLRAAGPKEILARMLGNLKQVYVARREYQPALECSERILMLVPAAAREIRDRGLLYQQLECFGAAVQDLEQFLAMAPTDSSAPAIRRALPPLRAQAGRVS